MAKAAYNLYLRIESLQSKQEGDLTESDEEALKRTDRLLFLIIYKRVKIE